MRVVAGSVNIAAAPFPYSPHPTGLDPETVAGLAVQAVNQCLSKKDHAGLASIFAEDGYWRDHLAMSWSFRTVHGRAGVRSFLEENPAGPRLKSIELEEEAPAARKPQHAFLDAAGEVHCVQFCFVLKTAVGSGQGVARMIETAPGEWKIYTLYTVLLELAGHEENTFARRPKGVQHGGEPGRKNWADRRDDERNFRDEYEPDVLILGETFVCCAPLNTSTSNASPHRRRPSRPHHRRPPQGPGRQLPHGRQERPHR